MKVRDLCSPQVVTVEPGASLREAALAMRNQHVGALIVVERKDGVARPVGILTDRDIVVAVIAVPGARPEGIRVADVDDRPGDLTAATQVLLRRRHFVRVSRAEADDGPFVEEGADDGTPDATRASRHQNSFAGELKIHGAGLSSGRAGQVVRSERARARRSCAGATATPA